jgi:tol-pal system protein YbgF
MTKTSTRAIVASVFVLAVLGGDPASARDKEHQQLAADLRILQEQSQQLQNLLGQLSDALKAVNQRLDDQGKANQKAFADQKLIIDTVSKDLAIVREKLDDTSTRVGSISQEVDVLRQALQQATVPRQSTAVEPADGAAPGGGAPTEPAAAGSQVSTIAVGVSPQRLLDGARADYAAGLWDLAITGFRAYITSFPKSDMADDAQVLIGNSYLQDGKFERAVDAYDLAIRTYPSGNAIPEAYYKKGLAHRGLKQMDQARQAFEYVIKTYPLSDATLLARQALTQLAGPAAR